MRLEREVQAPRRSSECSMQNFSPTLQNVLWRALLIHQKGCWKGTLHSALVPDIVPLAWLPSVRLQAQKCQCKILSLALPLIWRATSSLPVKAACRELNGSIHFPRGRGFESILLILGYSTSTGNYCQWPHFRDHHWPEQEQKLSWISRSRDPAEILPAQEKPLSQFPGLRFKLPFPCLFYGLCQAQEYTWGKQAEHCRARCDNDKSQPTDTCFGSSPVCKEVLSMARYFTAQRSKVHMTPQPQEYPQKSVTPKIQVPLHHLLIKPHSAYVLLLWKDPP